MKLIFKKMASKKLLKKFEIAGSRKRISRTAAVDLILTNPGRFLTVVSDKIGGVERTFNGMVKKDTKVSNLGFITIYDVHSKGYRKVNTREIKYLSLNGLSYRVK